MNRILIVEDEHSISEMTRLCLSKNGYICETADNGLTALEMVEKNTYDLILLDIMLPEIDGYEMLDYIKQYSVPVIFVTAKSSVKDRVKGLKLGAEDYITKPFDLEELLARVEAVLRRFHKAERNISFGDIIIDTLAHTVTKSGENISLSAKEYELLLYFMRNKNIALYREIIYEQVWHEPYYGNTRTIDLHVQRIKKKLNLGDAIESVYKIGYKFIPEKLS